MCDRKTKSYNLIEACKAKFGKLRAHKGYIKKLTSKCIKTTKLKAVKLDAKNICLDGSDIRSLFNRKTVTLETEFVPVGNAVIPEFEQFNLGPAGNCCCVTRSFVQGALYKRPLQSSPNGGVCAVGAVGAVNPLTIVTDSHNIHFHYPNAADHELQAIIASVCACVIGCNNGGADYTLFNLETSNFDTGTVGNGLHEDVTKYSLNTVFKSQVPPSQSLPLGNVAHSPFVALTPTMVDNIEKFEKMYGRDINIYFFNRFGEMNTTGILSELTFWGTTDYHAEDVGAVN